MVRRSFAEQVSRICWVQNISFNSRLLFRHFANIFSIACPPFVVVAELNYAGLMLYTGRHASNKKATGFMFSCGFRDLLAYKWQKKKPQVFGDPWL
jgi:hypothetical protein